MNPLKIALLAGALGTVGAIAALSAPGPDGDGRGRRLAMGGPGAWWHGGMRGQTGALGRARMMTADEYDTRTRERFARLDRNSDGVLDRAEIVAALVGRLEHSHGREGAAGDGFMQRFGDKDGKVTKAAFLAEIGRRFAAMDLNNDGKITDDDLPPTMRGRGMLKADGPPLDGQFGQRLGALRRADVNHDGVITRDAVVAAATQRFDQLDRNHDGVIDKSDFEIGRKEMLDYGVRRFLHRYGADADGKVTRDQFYKVAKERFVRLDTRGKGKIDIGPRLGRDAAQGPWRGGPPGGPPVGPGGPAGPPPGPPPRN